MSNESITKGGCMCGAVRFSYTGAPIWVLHCHCESCRRATSSPMTTMLAVMNDQFTVDQGEPRTYHSSPGATRTFCGSCGSPLSFAHERFPGEMHFYVASLDDPTVVEPTRHVFFQERVSWCDLHDDLPRFNEGSDNKTPDSRGPSC